MLVFDTSLVEGRVKELALHEAFAVSVARGGWAVSAVRCESCHSGWDIPTRSCVLETSRGNLGTLHTYLGIKETMVTVILMFYYIIDFFFF